MVTLLLAPRPSPLASHPSPRAPRPSPLIERRWRRKLLVVTAEEVVEIGAGRVGGFKGRGLAWKAQVTHKILADPAALTGNAEFLAGAFEGGLGDVAFLG